MNNDYKKQLNQEYLYFDSLSFEYTNIYHIDLKTGIYKVLKSNGLFDALAFSKGSNYFPDLSREYCKSYVIEEDRERLEKLLDVNNIKEILAKEKEYIFYYEVKSNKLDKRYFEGRLIRIDNNGYDALLGFRYNDEAIKYEKEIQNNLKEALNKVSLSNEIISAISKIYFALYRVDLNLDHYDEVRAKGDYHELTGNSGKFSSKIIEFCDTFVSDQYLDIALQFTDLSTLKQRLKDDDTIALEYLNKEGNWQIARFIVKRRDENNVPTNVIFAIRSINEQKRKEARLIAELENAKKNSEVMSNFLSMLSHDIRTPINSIKGFSELAYSDADNQEKIKKDLIKIMKSCDYLISIVDNTLDTNQIEKGTLTINKEEISIGSFTKELEGYFKSSSLNSKRTFILNVHDIIYDHIIIDVTKLKQIIINLFINACNYTADDGHVWVDISETLNDNKLKLLVEVSDDGIGMSQEFQTKMYDKFTREIDTRVSQVRGLGLGLNIVKTFTELLDGEISVDSNKDKGTCFKLSFDVAYVTSTKQEKETTFFFDKQINVLVTEDNDLNYEVLTGLILIADKNIKVTRATNGLECVDIYCDNPGGFDCILMDVKMPVMDGLTATRLLREKGYKVPIVAVTANVFEKDKKECLDAGMNYFVTKPIDINNLLMILKEIDSHK